MTRGIKIKQTQIEGVRHSSSKMRRLQRAEDITNGLWVPTPFRMTNLGWKSIYTFYDSIRTGIDHRCYNTLKLTNKIQWINN